MDTDSLILFADLYPLSTLIFIGVLGACIGSFLNVVIYRLPRLLLVDWYQQASALLRAYPTPPDINDPHFRMNQLNDTVSEDTTPAVPPFNLCFPRSHCTHCQHSLPWWCNIPLVSFLILRGRCHFCRQPISWRYILIEGLSALLPIIVISQLGFHWSGLMGILLTWFLVVMTFIDLDHQLLPDNLTLPLIWIGLLLNLFNVFTTLESALIGAIAGYLSFWLIAQGFYRVTGREGMGYGDFKLVAAFGAWFGWPMLILLILIASFLGAIVGISIHLIRRHRQSVPLPFGPYLAFAGWLCLCWGNEILQTYLLFLTPA
ncbi:MAG: type prepilin-like protein leader peptide-processing enzyme [Gammaproteobacteria bacterium]|jgi:leader peptidase (prepilin peptidase)/N-methyltransferase|nr:type prepilin-like protein leader peptide-processing enzyme [Gammaproteobacteria bacterium]